MAKGPFGQGVGNVPAPHYLVEQKRVNHGSHRRVSLALECISLGTGAFPDRVFLTQPFGGGHVRQWTWAQAVGEARRMAAYPQGAGVGTGLPRRHVLRKNCAWWIMADLAIWMSGHVTVPIYPSLKAQSIRQILEHCGAQSVLSRRHRRARGGRTRIPCRASPGCAFPNATEDGDASWEVLVESNRPIAARRCERRTNSPRLSTHPAPRALRKV